MIGFLLTLLEIIHHLSMKKWLKKFKLDKYLSQGLSLEKANHVFSGCHFTS